MQSTPKWRIEERRDVCLAPRDKIYQDWSKASSRRLPIIDFQNEIVEMYVAREGVEEGEEEEVGEGGGSSNGLLEGGWEKIAHLL